MGVEDNAECELGILLEGHGLWDEVAEAGLRDEAWVCVVEVHDHDGGVGDEG